MVWGKLKVDMGMALEPAIVFGFVGIEIVENDSMPSRNSLDSAGLQTLRVIQKTLQCLIGYLLDLRIDEGGNLPNLGQKICQFGLPREMIVIRTVFGAFEGRVVPKPLGNLVEQFCEFQALI
jgi:hypothetical protein